MVSVVTKPSYDTAARRAYQRAYRAAGKDTAYKSHNVRLPFVGVDGEGGNTDAGYHAYFLLRAGQQSIIPTGSNVRLSTKECLNFLCDLPRDAIYVVYFGDYDVTKFLEDMGWSRLEKLIKRSSRERKDGKGLWPVDFGEFQLDYLPRKEFKVRRRKGTYVDPKTGKDKIEWEPWLIINDVGSFFQCRFVEALEKWGIGTAEERELIGGGKEQRGNFTVRGSDSGLDTTPTLEEIERYNALEISLLQELMEKFREACVTVGYVPARWQGPGQLAEAMLAKHGVPRTKDVPLLQEDGYTELLTYAQNAFYGGRPELSAIGPVDRPVYQFDINSAYPRAMLDVPCLLHGAWEFVSFSARAIKPLAEEVTADGRIGILYGSFVPVRDPNGRFPLWYGLPIRTKEGSIRYPGAGRGWYWSPEILSARHQRFSVESAWLYRADCDCKPLGFVGEVYEERKRLGKDGAGIVLKLGLNSLYGKQVQSIGTPKYANPIWGSFITSYCRTMIQDFIHSSELCTRPDGWCGKDVLMIATDSVSTWNPREDIEPSGELGGWSVEVHPRGMFLVQPGLYFGSSGKPAKTRGVPRSVIETYEERFRNSFQSMVRTRNIRSGDVSVPQRLFVGIRYALHRHNLKLLGQWIEFTDPETGETGKKISFDWTTKRVPWPVLDPIPGFSSYLETFPYEGDPTIESLPYSKDIGGLLLRDSLRKIFEDQPDWVPQIELGEMGNGIPD